MKRNGVEDTLTFSGLNVSSYFLPKIEPFVLKTLNLIKQIGNIVGIGTWLLKILNDA